MLRARYGVRLLAFACRLQYVANANDQFEEEALDPKVPGV